MKQLLLSVVAGIAVAAWGNNLFPEDTDFETGTQNFRYYRSAEPIRTVSGDAASGNSSRRKNAISAMRQLCSATLSCRPPEV